MKNFRILICSVLMVFSLGILKAERPNILFVTVDDMNCDSVGVFGSKLEGTTPNMDAFAKQGLRFKYAHVQVGNCMPGRNVMFSGLFSHNNRMEGFYEISDPDYPHISDLMKEGGYLSIIFGKVAHSSPNTPWNWSLNLDVIDGEKLHIKDPNSYYRATQRGIAESKKAGKRFFLNVNISDPHKPFYGMTSRQQLKDDPYKPSKMFTREEMPVPGFLFDDPQVRFELAYYYMSVRRADDCFGEVLRALEESGQSQNTLVMFLSDHGMPLPFAKTALWHHSTHTPWMVRWPGNTQPNSIDDQHMISAVDLMPTLLEAAEIQTDTKFDGRSFLPLLHGKTQNNRSYIIKEYNENVAGGRHPMRGVQTKEYLYLFNPWSDGTNKFKTATKGTLTYVRMNEIAQTDPVMEERLRFFNHRVIEELYDIRTDPDCLNNLANHPDYRDQMDFSRATLKKWMVKSKDHALEALENLKDPESMYAYVARYQKEAYARIEARKAALINRLR
tara:strand:- start:740 stop:2242 length:1503 start_codon:yes stop_codon:yes gene_type:complete